MGAKRTLFPESEGVPLEAGTSPVARRSVAQLDSQSQRVPVWTVTEEQALVNFLLIYTDGYSWSSRAGKDDRFWESVGAYVQGVVYSEYCRTGRITFQYVSTIMHACTCMY